jgi:DNA-binding MarR family transcriptional regulator
MRVRAWSPLADGLLNQGLQLQQHGLAVRSRDSEDRRLIWVTLIREGAELALRTHAEVTARANELIARLPGANQGRLSDAVYGMLADR